MERQKQILSEYEVEPCENCGSMGYLVPPKLGLGINVKCLECGCGWRHEFNSKSWEGEKSTSVFVCLTNFDSHPLPTKDGQ